MQLIVAVDENWGIGCKGKLLFSSPEDMRHFMQITLGKTVVMGRATLESLPRSEPLNKRINVVLSSDHSLKYKNAFVCNSIDELLRFVSIYKQENVIVIGGQLVYKELLEYCSAAYITRFYTTVSNADTFFPDVDKMNHWKLIDESEKKEYEDILFSFCTYHNSLPKSNPYCEK